MQPTTAQWLDGPLGAERAMYVMACSLGFALFERLFDGQLPLAPDTASSTWIARSMQRMVTDYDMD